MSSIFEFVKEGKSAPISVPSESRSNSSIFEAAKELPVEKERTRTQSITAAPIKGILKGTQQQSEFALLPRGPIPSELANRAIEEFFPTEKKLPEELLERAGRVSTGLIGGGKGIASRAIRGGLAVGAGQLVKAFGGSENAQQLAETGALLSPTVVKGAEKFVSGLYGQANKLSKDAVISAKNLAPMVREFIKELEVGGTAPSKVAALKKAKEILSKIKKGKISVNELTGFKQTINEARAGLYAEPGITKEGKKTAKRNLNNISKVVDNALSEYGKMNTEWNRVYRQANEGHGAIANSKKVSNWIANTIKQHPHATGTAIAGSLIGHALNPKAFAITLGGAGVLKTGELIARIAKSKVLRKYYGNAIKEAVKQNTSGFLNAIKKLSNDFSKEKEED